MINTRLLDIAHNLFFHYLRYLIFMQIYSTAFKNGEGIPDKYTCKSEGVNPPLYFRNVPKKAESLVLVMDDIDVPVENRPDGIWNHWLVINMPSSTTKVPESSKAPGIEVHTTGGEFEYQPPCPPSGEHRYFFKLYALDKELDLDPEETYKGDVLKAMEGHILEEAELMGRCKE